jgi:hypothetical protein
MRFLDSTGGVEVRRAVPVKEGAIWGNLFRRRFQEIIIFF